MVLARVRNTTSNERSAAYQTTTSATYDPLSAKTGVFNTKIDKKDS